MPEQVESLEDPRLALYRGVADPELARSHNLFIAEGRLVVRRVLEDPRYAVRSVLLNDSAHRDLSPILARRDPAVPVLLCETGDFARITGFDIHRGCRARVERPAPAAVADLIAHARRVVILDGVANPDNVGGVFRNAAAFGVDAVLLSPDAGDPFYRKAVRTSMAAVVRVPFARCESWPADLAHVRRAGLMLVALTPSADAAPIDAFAAHAAGRRLALVLGAEASGVTPAVQALADERVRIPIRSDVDSLNVASAAAIALHCLREP